MGSVLTPDVGADGILSPGESVTQVFVIGLQVKRGFFFFLDIVGTPQL